jgi:hypothetical protein
MKLEKKDLNDRIDASMKEVYSKIENGSVVPLDRLSDLLKLILREYLWCELVSLDEDVSVTFGYDYYMYFHSNTDIEGIVKKIEDIGLYVD